MTMTLRAAAAPASALLGLLLGAAVVPQGHGAEPVVPAQAPVQAQAPVEARVPWAPAVVAATDGARHLAYELHLSNFYRSTGPLRLQRLEVYGDDANTPLASFEGEALRRITNAAPADPATPAQPLEIGGGLRLVAFVWVTLPADAPAPRSLRHRVAFETAQGVKSWVDGARVAVDAAAPVRLGPPLSGGQWLAYEGPSNSQSHHWGSLVAINGEVTVPQRYAIDLVGLDANGHALRDGAGELRKTRHADWIGYGAQVLAVADGIVRGARDGDPEHAPLSPQTEPPALTADTVYGNHVILEIAPKVFVHYAHLQPGSVKVRVGDRVRRGQALGLLGQSGSSGGPHLHLHVANAATFEESEGLPFVFERFSFSGRRGIDQALDPASAFESRPQPRQQQLPLDNDVIGFDATP